MSSLLGPVKGRSKEGAEETGVEREREVERRTVQEKKNKKKKKSHFHCFTQKQARERGSNKRDGKVTNVWP